MEGNLAARNELKQGDEQTERVEVSSGSRWEGAPSRRRSFEVRFGTRLR